jgi:hypothetical protein
MKPYGIQMFSSPGIRKDERNNQEMAEDATGFIVKNNYIVLWVADGAPGSNIRTQAELKGLNFNSRVLAKYLGTCFESIAFKYGIPKAPLDEAFYEEFKVEVQKELFTHLEIIREYLKQKRNQINLDSLPTQTVDGEECYSFEWGAAFAAAIIDLENETCSTMSIGDCFAVINDKIVMDKSNRLFVDWFITKGFEASKPVDFVTNTPHFDKVEDMKSVILMSDGNLNENEFVKKFANKDADAAWDELKNINSTTDDDKTAIFFRIME